MLRAFSGILLLLIAFQSHSFAQSDDVYIALLTPSELTKRANSVVRYEKQTVEIEAYNKMYVTTKRIVTIFNKYGIGDHNAYEFYDDNTKIKELEAHIYDAAGEEIKKIKSRDFIDQSAVSGGTLYSDNRVKYLDYTPLKYPFTIEYYSEVELRSTAFIPQWRPIDDYYVAVQYSEYQLINNSSVEVRTKKENFDNYAIESLGSNHFVAKKLKGIKPEEYSPNLSTLTPCFKSALTQFDMEGVDGINNNWEDFGKWMYDKLITGTDDLPQSAIDDVRALTNGVDDKMERAKIVYDYMQNKTRYISVQVGIGGWKPMFADEVDRLGYGDCKGLTNYTKALLEVVDVPSYYTVVWGDRNIKNIDREFSVTEGNHVILCVPDDNDNVFLECTSQTNPFGFTAGFTDDRDVLLVTPEGGKIVHTKVYSPEDSQQITTAKIVLDETGGFKADVSVKSTGYQYGIHEGIETKPLRDQELYYKNYWDNINNLTINSISQDNNKDKILYTESLNVSAANYASKTGSRLILQPNLFNVVSQLPARYDKRYLDFKVQRGYKDVDEFIFLLPEGMSVEAMTDNDSFETKFGTYSFSIEKTNNNQLKYSRTFIMNKGNYTKEDYKKFRDFMKRIVKADKSKIVLISK
ncbi:DUF3857 domain-containing protein [Winogradskyella sp. A3E31]|uniref:DUF3857 domain-containing protein n=1 Tax=Winogradskyella sp. A3E31 TaxID=3349637 RepID=UPI00398A61AC